MHLTNLNGKVYYMEEMNDHKRPQLDRVSVSHAISCWIVCLFSGKRQCRDVCSGFFSYRIASREMILLDICYG